MCSRREVGGDVAAVSVDLRNKALVRYGNDLLQTFYAAGSMKEAGTHDNMHLTIEHVH